MLHDPTKPLIFALCDISRILLVEVTAEAVNGESGVFQIPLLSI